MNGNPLALPPIEADQPCFKCHRTGPHVVDRFAQRPSRWDDPERFMHASGLCPEPPSTPVPTATDLPAGSVVATATLAYFRQPDDANPVDPDYHWRTTNGMTACDAQVDLVLQGGYGTVLRVGSGA